jgi:hypothetical protein
MRDFLVEMREFIDLRARGEYRAPDLANEIVEELKSADPKLLRGWLELMAPALVRDVINQRNRSTRSYNRTIAGRDPETRSVFRGALAAAEAGNGAPAAELGEKLEQRQSEFLNERYVVEGGSQKALGDMTRADLNFAAENYREQAKSYMLQVAFLQAVARKVGTRTVAEVFSEETIAKMWRSLPGHK